MTASAWNAMFAKGFRKFAGDGDMLRCDVEGFTITAAIHHDSDSGAPWKENDGHGPVSEWTSRGKSAGERVLISDRHCSRYYNFSEAVKIAKRDGWGVAGGKQEKETDAQYATRAAEHDFSVIKAWCNDEWSWCGIVVTASREGIELGTASLWGIELNYPGSDNAYLLEVANELLPEAITAAKATLAELFKGSA